MHYAAQGGNTLILDDILDTLEKKCPTVNFLEEKCIRGQCALHFAIKHQHKNMIDHIIKLHSDKKNQNAESTATHQESEFDTVRGEFSPVHLAALFGDTRLLTTLMKNGFKMNRKTRIGLISWTLLACKICVRNPMCIITFVNTCLVIRD